VLQTQAAQDDPVDIWVGIAVDNAAAANRVLDEIGAKLVLLQDFPQLGPERSDMRDGLRMLVVRDYLVLYRLEPEYIEVVRVLHRRDLSALGE
jgi:toxin ParE1/3/4